MAVTLSADLTELHDCDSIANWTGTDIDLDTEVYREGTGSIGQTKATQEVVYWQYDYYTDHSNTYLDITGDTHFYFWINCSNALDTQAGGGIRFRITDASSNYKEWWVGGSDSYFGGWQPYVVYTGASANDYSVTAPNLAQIRYISYYLDVTGKTTVNAHNAWLDITYYGTGITVKGGTSGDKGTFQEVLDADTTPAYGVLAKKYGAYVLQGPITFGDNTGATTTYFSDSNQIVIFADALVSSTHYAINVVGNSTGTNSVQLGNVTGSGSSMVGSEGIVFKSANSSLPFSVDAGDNNIDELKLYGNSFINASNVYLGDSSTALGKSGSTIDLVDNSFSNPTQIFRNISSSATATALRNSIVSANDTRASMDLYDGTATTSDEWTIIEGPGYEDSAGGSTTITITGESFPSTSTNKPYLSITDSSQVFNLNNTNDSAGGRVGNNISSQTELAFDGNSNGNVNENYIVTWSVKTPGGTAINTARVKIVESAPSAAIANEDSTDSGGDASSTYLRANYVPSGADTITTTTHTPQAFKVYKYGYLPSVSSATINQAITNYTAMLDDSFQDEATASNALTLGDTTNTVSIENQTNPATLLKYTSGTGTLSVGQVIGNSLDGAEGTVVEIIEGDSTEGTVLMDTRNATTWPTSAHTLDNSGGGWSATFTTGSIRSFTWLVDADSLTMQQLYDYFNAKADESPLDTASPTYFDDVVVWGRAEHGLPIQGSGSKFKTVRNVTLTEGWAIYNTDVGGVDFYTADDGSVFTPASTVNLTVNVVDKENSPIQSAQTAIYLSADDTELMNQDTTAGGIASTSYTYTGDVDVYYRVRKSSTGDTRYTPVSGTGTIESSGFSVTVILVVDTKIT